MSESSIPQNHEQALTPDADRDQIRQFFNLIFTNTECIELRAISTDRKGQTAVGFFNNIDAAVHIAASYHGRAAIYVGLNPRPGVLLHAQPANVMVQNAEGAKDHEIVCRRWFPIDIDTIRPSKKVAASNEEIAAAKSVYDQVLADLKNKGVTPYIGLSGNGRHLLVQTIDYPVTCSISTLD